MKHKPFVGQAWDKAHHMVILCMLLALQQRDKLHLIFSVCRNHITSHDVHLFQDRGLRQAVVKHRLLGAQSTPHFSAVICLIIVI